MMSVPWVLSRLEICPHHADDTIWQKQREKEERRKRKREVPITRVRLAMG